MFNKEYLISKTVYDLTHDIYLQSKEMLMSKFIVTISKTSFR